ncbi:hypothetical protein EXIGLDRAFT_771529 [Exidia glandulosa HHB12029]|uniref:Uncharacterized protein n=1 Tax=Exidia glandulosa HHB12029 TaxID=1314781 RepID=A0A165FY92_EXIGL|nr:hypothetical protein EXIGLDRAFT_771529 [Exidia glandulosa HHB12029]
MDHHLIVPFIKLGAMQRLATFNDLPVELAERIIRLAALHALNDKAWLALLTRTSRAIHTLVQPILVETVFITAWTLPRIFFFPTLFVSTRHLIVERKCRSEYLRYIVLTTPAFQQIDILCRSACALDILLNVCTPSRVLVTRYPRSEHEWTATPDELDSHLSRLTHFRGMFNSAVLLLYLMGEDRWKSLPIHNPWAS